MFPEKEPVFTYPHQLRSRYGETDKMGYVYYGRYLEYFEESRTEMIRSLGFSYARLEDNGVMLPVVHTEVDYKAPVFYDELMKIEVLLYDIPAVKLETYYRVFTDRREAPHILGKVVLCFMNEENRKPCRAPADFIDTLSSVVES
ncbi:acyl-CoA thioesterase [Fodinibius sp.]|uniref:acyl-CoA thioesterase n=1 Tax=Fodinibius sp. TaxID=1872440 RepID=UPI003562DBFF